jgi:hypothetical protein
MQRGILTMMLILMSPAVFAIGPVDFTFAVPGVAVIVIIFLGIMSMMASATSDPRLEAWAKTEIREFVAALIIVGIVVGFFITSNTIAAALGGGANYIASALNVTDKWIGWYDSAFEYAIRAAAKIRVGATFSPYMSVPLWYVGINYATTPLAGTAILLLPLNLAAGGLTNAIYITEGIRMLVIFLLITGPKILLPLSLCLRLIPFSRRLGNTMIAVSLAGMVFLPASILIADALNGTITVPSPHMTLSVLDPNPTTMAIFQPICAAIPLRAILSMTDPLFAVIVCLPIAWIPGAFAVCYPIVQNIVYPILMVVFQLVNSISLIAWEMNFEGGSGEQYANAVFDQVQPFLKDVNNLVFLGYLDFIIIGIITMTGARSLSSALGGEWYMAGIQRLI